MDQQTPRQQETVGFRLYYEEGLAPIAFAAHDLATILSQRATNVQTEVLTELGSSTDCQRVVLSTKRPATLAALQAAGGTPVMDLKEQAYALRVTATGNQKTIWIIGGDRIGTMYGGIHVGEIINAHGLSAIKDQDHHPYIAKRGIKFNIPLDDRLPSHDDRGTAAQMNIVNMWDFGFWQDYLDTLARQRYNVLSLWNKHPFPALVKLDDYPSAAADDVYSMTGKVLDMTIDEKIALWQRIMEHAYQRGIEIYFITWNIHMGTGRAKHGVWENARNEKDIDYLRQSVKALFLTYPRLAGIGVTAGENMQGMSSQEKETWLWKTYGLGIQDVQAVQPDRHIRFIHRYWWTRFNNIDRHFGQLKNGYDMSFKYAKARLYAHPAPPFAQDALLPRLPEHKATWWNLRNDDIYNLRWGDPNYVKQFILNLPPGNKTAGYYMGSDRYVWARESISKQPLSPRMLENEKHWYRFLLWGRLGYDPNTPADLFKGLIHHRFPTVSSDDLFTAWQSASQVVPLVNQFHWFAWDYQWWVEACMSSGSGNAIAGYHDIHAFIHAPTMEVSGFVNIVDYADAIQQNKPVSGKTPFDVADMIATASQTALAKTAHLRGEGNQELSETIGDIRAMAHLGLYYAAKIRGATHLRLYQVSQAPPHKTNAIVHLEEALDHWQAYTRILETQYHKMHLACHRVFDWDKIAIEVRQDITIARNTAP